MTENWTQSTLLLQLIYHTLQCPLTTHISPLYYKLSQLPDLFLETWDPRCAKLWRNSTSTPSATGNIRILQPIHWLNQCSFKTNILQEKSQHFSYGQTCVTAHKREEKIYQFTQFYLKSDSRFWLWIRLWDPKENSWYFLSYLHSSSLQQRTMSLNVRGLANKIYWIHPKMFQRVLTRHIPISHWNEL